MSDYRNYLASWASLGGEPKNPPRAIVSVAYDGTSFTTPWDPALRNTPSAQYQQANFHRERVLRYLDTNGLRRLPAPRWPSLEDAA